MLSECKYIFFYADYSLLISGLDKHTYAKILDMDIDLAFGILLRRLREAENLSQEKLAEKCDLHRTYIGMLERGKRQPSLRVLQKFALVLNVSLPSMMSELEILLSDKDENR
jgi:DNA-binding XRE family transcriptional regulator